jgi:hypothetical protein
MRRLKTARAGGSPCSACTRPKPGRSFNLYIQQQNHQCYAAAICHCNCPTPNMQPSMPELVAAPHGQHSRVAL